MHASEPDEDRGVVTGEKAAPASALEPVRPCVDDGRDDVALGHVGFGRNDRKVGSATTQRHRWLRAGLLVTLGLTMVPATTASGVGARPDATSALPRSQTLYVSGKQWGPYTDFNPFRSGDYATGVVGLVYETLFRYDPLKDRYIPWLATNGRWQGTTYVVTLRPRREVERRQAVDGGRREVLVRDREADRVPVLARCGDRAAADHAAGDYTVRFRFRGTPNYQEWDSNCYSIPIAPQHIW